MQNNQPTNSVRAFKAFIFLAVCGLGLWFQPLLKADVVVLQNGSVITGNVLQQDGNGVLIQMESGTYRFPLSSVSDVKKEAAAAPHVSNNGKRIPDWAQIVNLLANTGWSQGLKQVPATMIESGVWKNVPYVSFRCRSDGYEVNIFGDLNNPAAVQIGAMSFLSQNADARSNCVNFICSVLASADARKMVRALNWNQKDTQKNAGMTFETILPGEWGSYGGWWVSVYNDSALANAQASETELLAITQPRVAAPPPVAAAQPAATTTTGADLSDATASQPAAAPASAQPVTTTTSSGVVTTYGAYPAWTAEEMATARPVNPASNPAGTGAYPSATGNKPASASAYPASTAGKVYPRSYDRAGGSYGARR
jgi:hypothetical protein